MENNVLLYFIGVLCCTQETQYFIYFSMASIMVGRNQVVPETHDHLQVARKVENVRVEEILQTWMSSLKIMANWHKALLTLQVRNYHSNQYCRHYIAKVVTSSMTKISMTGKANGHRTLVQQVTPTVWCATLETCLSLQAWLTAWQLSETQNGLIWTVFINNAVLEIIIINHLL